MKANRLRGLRFSRLVSDGSHVRASTRKGWTHTKKVGGEASAFEMAALPKLLQANRDDGQDLWELARGHVVDRRNAAGGHKGMDRFEAAA